MTQFKKYQHVERLGVDEVTGLLNGTVYVQPKIDGSNGQVWLQDDRLHFGSRRREVSIDDDNAGFANHFQALETSNPLVNYLRKYPNRILYGEWLVQHVVRYRKDAYQQFYVFDVLDATTEKYISYQNYTDELDAFGILQVPLLAVVDAPSETQIVGIAKANHFLLSSEVVGEGVVVKNYEFTNQYGRTVWGKYVLDDFKKSKGVKKAIRDKTAGINPYGDVIESLVTKAFVEKEFLKFKESLGDERFTAKLIPRLLETIYHEFINEESWHLIRKFRKNPVIDFNAVQRSVYEQIKNNLPMLFGRL